MTGADTGSRRILLLDFPLALMDRARQHRDALLREFAFIVNTENESSVPARLLEIARHSDEHYADLNPESELLCDEAIARGETSLDLELVVPPEDLQEDWDALLEQAQTDLEEMKSIDNYTEYFNSGEEPFEETNALATDLGLEDCSQ